MLLHLTPASSACPQLLVLECEQLIRNDSVPVHCTSSITIFPVPCPKYALDNAVPNRTINYCKNIVDIHLLKNIFIKITMLFTTTKLLFQSTELQVDYCNNKDIDEHCA